MTTGKKTNLTAALVVATPLDYPIIQNMARFYVYDMSRFCGHLSGWECPDNGLFECVDLKNYFEDPTKRAFLIMVGSERAGFALMNKIGSTPDVDWHMGEFFVLAKFQGSGIGQQIAEDIFKRFHGVWEVSVIPENTRALGFWRNVIDRFTQGVFSQTQKLVPHPEPHPMVIFRFNCS